MNRDHAVEIPRSLGIARTLVSAAALLLLPPFVVLALAPMLLVLIPVAMVGIPFLVPALLPSSIAAVGDERRIARLRAYPRPRLVAAALSCVFAVACTTGGNGDLQLPDNVDCNGTPPTFAQVTGLTKCAACHDSNKTGAARQKAPGDIDFDTQAGAEAHAEKAASEVNTGAMPPASSGITLTDAEKQQLYAWALCPM